MKTPKPPTAPKTLSVEARGIWSRLHGEFALADAGAVEILDAGLHSFDTLRQAEALLKKDGIVVLDRYGTPKAHPAADIARQARAQWLAALRMLGLHAQGDEEGV